VSLGEGIFLGTSAFTSLGWAGSFYPKGVKSADHLTFYATHVDMAEVDSTFYFELYLAIQRSGIEVLYSTTARESELREHCEHSERNNALIPSRLRGFDCPVAGRLLTFSSHCFNLTLAFARAISCTCYCLSNARQGGPLQTSRRDFFKLSIAGGAAASVLGFDLAPAYAELRELKIARASETRSTCPYCAVSCGVIIYTLGDKAKNVTLKSFMLRATPTILSIAAPSARKALRSNKTS